MTSEEIFISALGDFINKRKSLIDIGHDDETSLINLAKKHNVGGIIYHQINIQELKKNFAATLALNLNREIEAELLFQTLSQFEYFPIKGECLAPLYPVPQLRTMGDMDIMIREQDRLAIHALLCNNLGYINTTQGKTVWNYRKRGLELEIHTKMINAKFNYDQKFEEYFSKCWDYVSGHELEWNYHFLYLIAHLRKHFMYSGVGFRQFMDIAIAELNVNLDWHWIEKEAKAIGLFDFMRTVLSYIDKWFGIKSPYGMVELEHNLFDISTKFILDNGVFGFANTENEDNISVNQYIDTGKKDIYGLVRRAFPKHDQLVREGYMAEEQSGIRIPFAWGKRIWDKRSRYRQLKKLVLSSDRINKRKQLYIHWGLYSGSQE